ncbi:hypothetical protein F2Q70_00013948 [Brassica cretica]|uniref:Uncharacterized protein n=1 Tax=Brassica cretica TaxID=69181 RepID=A0A3N6TF75_BRACR|nr:hypothetical protein F2Q70_00013948 [Brassica cretica]
MYLSGGMMMKNVRLYVTGWVMVWWWWWGSCMGRFVVEKNSLRVTSPESIRGIYECALGNFGVPQYGGSMSGSVVYPKANQKACKNFEDFDISFRSRVAGLPTFVLVDRGDCYFTLKAWNAQRAGAATILVADNRPEPLITMDAPEDETADAEYLQNITIPSALLSRSLGSAIKTAIDQGEPVRISLDWRDALPHPNDRVAYELWTNSNDECGSKCDAQIRFLKRFKGAAQILEKGGYTRFTPHYITWYCPEAFLASRQCKSQCINGGRYCAPDPEQDFSRGYNGRDVIIQNLRQACFFRVMNESGKPWIWWDYVTDFAIRCPMKHEKYNKQCADQVIRSLGKLERSAVLKALCSGFRETTEPPICLTEDIETNECLQNNGGCWEDKTTNITACRDTFRGRVCQCPIVQGVKFLGDGYTHCEASGALRCGINNGGCWKHTQMGRTYSACRDDHSKGCKCPPGFKGDGLKNCEDVNECEEKTACQCRGCKCKNTWGSYECSCSGSLLYIREHDICISKDARGDVSWGVIWIILMGLGAAALGAYTVYKYRIRTYMDSEIRAIMAQYMPLDNHPNTQPSSQLEL